MSSMLDLSSEKKYYLLLKLPEGKLRFVGRQKELQNCSSVYTQGSYSYISNAGSAALDFLTSFPEKNG